MGFDGHVRDELDIPGRGNGGRPALSSQEAVIISRSMAQAMALGIEGQAGHEDDIELIGFNARVVRRCRPDAIGTADRLFQRVQAPAFNALLIDADRDIDLPSARACWIRPSRLTSSGIWRKAMILRAC